LSLSKQTPNIAIRLDSKKPRAQQRLHLATRESELPCRFMEYLPQCECLMANAFQEPVEKKSNS